MAKGKETVKGYKGTKKPIRKRTSRTPSQKNDTHIADLYDVKAKDIRLIMRWFGLSQKKLAEKLEPKRTQQYVSKMLSGIDVPVSTIKAIIEIIGKDEYTVLLSKVKSGKKPSFAITN